MKKVYILGLLVLFTVISLVGCSNRIDSKYIGTFTNESDPKSSIVLWETGRCGINVSEYPNGMDAKCSLDGASLKMTVDMVSSGARQTDFPYPEFRNNPIILTVNGDTLITEKGRRFKNGTSPNMPSTNNSASQTNPSTDPKSHGILTTEAAQDALNRFMSANAKGTMTIRGGVREIPAENSATAEIIMDTFRSNDGKFFPETTPYGRSLSWTTGKAVFSKYTDGRWVLSEVVIIQDSTGYTGTYKPNIEIR